jgi:putative transposase
VAMCRSLNVTQTTFYRWRRKYGDARATGRDEARALRDENLKLKQLVADLYLERQFMLDSQGKYSKSIRRRAMEEERTC